MFTCRFNTEKWLRPPGTGRLKAGMGHDGLRGPVGVPCDGRDEQMPGLDLSPRGVLVEKYCANSEMVT